MDKMLDDKKAFKLINEIVRLEEIIKQSKHTLLINACIKEIYKMVLAAIYELEVGTSVERTNIDKYFDNCEELNELKNKPIINGDYVFTINDLIQNMNLNSSSLYYPYVINNKELKTKEISLHISTYFVHWFGKGCSNFDFNEINNIDINKLSGEVNEEIAYAAIPTIENEVEEDIPPTNIEILNSGKVEDEMFHAAIPIIENKEDYFSASNKEDTEIEIPSLSDIKSSVIMPQNINVSVENDTEIKYGSIVNLRIQSNPFKQENKFFANDIPYFKNLKKKYRNVDISTLTNNFIEDLMLEFGVSELNIIFEGSKYDYEDLNALVYEYNRANGKKVTLNPGKLIYDLNKTKELKHLRYLIENSEVEALKDKTMLEYFDMYLEENNSVCVLATMSSGKSTLINSILGYKLMPSKNEACTAKIMHLKNNIQATTFTDIKGNAVSNDSLKLMNDDNNENVNIYLQGPIRAFNDIDNFEIIDTPGPNNSQDKSHKEITNNFIKSDKKHMVLVVLDGTKLLTTDEDNFINVISREQGEDGKIDNDRFLFVINKADEIDEDDSEESMKAKVINALKGYGIDKPRVHFVSSLNALLARSEQNNIALSPREEDKLYLLKRAAARGDFKFHEFSDLSPSVKSEIDKLIYEYKRNEDHTNLVIATSGILALELTIKEYMNKYKNIRKVRNIVKVCKSTIEKNDCLQDIKKVMAQDVKEKQALEKTIRELNQKISNDKKINQLKEEISSIKFGDSLAPIEKNINKEFQNFKKVVDELSFEIVNGKKIVDTVKANACIKKLQEKYENLRADLISELGKSIKKDVTDVIDNTINKYRVYVNSLCSDIKYNKQINIGEFVNAASPDFITLAKSCVIQETLEIVETVENPNKKGMFKMFKFWIPDYINVTKSKNKRGMELSTILQFVAEAREDLHKLYVQIKETRDSTKQKCLYEVNAQVNEFNKKIKNDLNKLCELKNSVNEKSGNIVETEKEIKRKAIVIKNIKQKLDNILEA